MDAAAIAPSLSMITAMVFGVLIVAAVHLVVVSVAPVPRTRFRPAPPRWRPGWILAGSWVEQAPPVGDDRKPIVSSRCVGATVLVGLVAVVDLKVAVVLVVVAAFTLLSRRRRKRLDREQQLTATTADLIDLYAVALQSGHNVLNASRQVARWAEGEAAASLLWCVHQADRGQGLADCLENVIERLGPTSRPLIAALVANERHGAPISGSLRQLSVDSRQQQRREAEARARKLPVLMLFPLVVCVLPAFLLLTVVPVVADSLLSFARSG